MYDRARETLIEMALEEDLALGDVTTNACVPGELPAHADIIAKQAGRVAGLAVFARVFAKVDDDVIVRAHFQEGDTVKVGDVVATVHGRARSLLLGERTALNFLQRMSGIATLTAQFVALIPSSTKTRITDTRKTTPGHRSLDKEAVRAGGGFNHRYCLGDAAMLKENHLRAAGGITRGVAAVRARNHHLLGVEVECTTVDEVKEALETTCTCIMLDNMNDAMLKKSVDVIRAHARGADVVVEASGNMTVARIPVVARIGVDVISVGALTHSVTAFDFSMQLYLDEQRTEPDRRRGDGQGRDQIDPILSTMSIRDRMHLMKYVCAYIWADEKLSENEFRLVHELSSRLKLSPDEREQVMEWLENPIALGELDPRQVPEAHRGIFLDAVRLVVTTDGRVSDAEARAIARLELAFGQTS